VKTLARLAGVDRAAFYGSAPTRLCAKTSNAGFWLCGQTGQHADPRDAQIARLTGQVAMLTTRAAARDTAITDLTAFKTAALSRLAAQHQEITRLRRAPAGPSPPP
jgi:hypothetical protein